MSTRSVTTIRAAGEWARALGAGTLLVLASACSDDGVGADAAVASIQLTFERLKPGTSFRAVATAMDEHNSVVPAARLTITSLRGEVSETTDEGGGVRAATITPDVLGTGRYEVTARTGDGGVSITRTALVLAEVGDRWGQPRAVEGLVNTGGWEDSIYITPDGQWLFVVYSPLSISCSWTGDFCDQAVGPWLAPERPDFSGQGRIASDGTVDNSCLGIAASDMPFVFPPFTYYGFRRQADGSFTEPFALSVEGSEGCIAPVALNAYPNGDGTSELLFDFDDHTGSWSGYQAAIMILGEPMVFGRWEGAWPNGSVEGFPGTAVPVPHGPDELGVNSYGYGPPNASISQIWFDNENLERSQIFVSVVQSGGAFPGGPWQEFLPLPAPVNDPAVDTRMPFFDGTFVTAYRDVRIESARYVGLGDGSDFDQAASWEPYVVDLAGDQSAEAYQATGTIVGVAEPTKTRPEQHPEGKEILYFNYITRAADGSFNLDVGFVEAGP